MKYINKIVNGDCYKLLKDIPDKSIDLVVTDPPYRIHADSGGGIHNNRDWLKKVHDSNLDEFDPILFLSEIKRVLKTFNAYIFCSKDLLIDYISFANENSTSACGFRERVMDSPRAGRATLAGKLKVSSTPLAWRRPSR